MHQHQLTPDLLSMIPLWTLNSRQHHQCCLHPHPLRWMWMRLLPRQVVEISGWTCLPYISTKHPDIYTIHILALGLCMGFVLWGGCKSWTLPGLRPVGEGVSRIYSTALLILLQHSVLQYFLLYIEQKLYGPLWVHLVLYSYLKKSHAPTTTIGCAEIFLSSFSSSFSLNSLSCYHSHKTPESTLFYSALPHPTHPAH